MVAPSYQFYEIVSEVYKSAGKEYVNIKHPNTGNIRKARWYSEIEYAKAYGKKLPNNSEKNGKPLFNQRVALGFGDNNYITIFKGALPSDEEYFSKSIARYCTYWGWYLPAGDSLEDLPPHILPVKIGWSVVSDSKDSLKDKDSVIKSVKNLLKEAC